MPTEAKYMYSTVSKSQGYKSAVCLTLEWLRAFGLRTWEARHTGYEER